MSTDAWRQWAAFAALFDPAAGLGALPGAAAAFAPFGDAETFAAAARAFYQSGADSQAAAAAFADFLRDQSAGVLEAWSGLAANRAAPSAIDAPALGPAREQQERLQRAAEAWRRLEQAQRRLQRLWSDVLTEAARAFVSRLGAPRTSLTPEALHGLYDAWIDCAEEAYARTAHAEPFGAALADFVQAGSSWRRELAASSEALAKWMDWPTRSEINSLALRVHALEAEQRAGRAEPAPPRRRAKKRRARGKR